MIVLTCDAQQRQYSAKRAVVKVTDASTGEVLPYATLTPTVKGAYISIADEKGNCVYSGINIPEEVIVSYTGYDSQEIKTKTELDTITVALSPATLTLQELVVRPHKEKYSKRNNPAVDFVRQLRSESEKHDPTGMPDYSYDKYEKSVFGIDNYKEIQEKGKTSKYTKALEAYTDTSAFTGKRVLNLILKEKRATRIVSHDPNADKEITTGYRGVGIDESLSQENMQAMFEEILREINIYGNDITLLTNKFVSPLSKIGPDFYKYYLADTVYVGDDKCLELDFVPHNPESMGFNGRIYVPLGDSTCFVKKITMRLPQAANLNYVDNIFINQTFEKDSLGNRHKTLDDVYVEMQIMPGTPQLFGRKTTRYSNFSYSKRKDLDEYYDKLGNIFELDESRSRDSGFWSEARMVPFTIAESRMGNLTSDMRQFPLFRWGFRFISLMESGFVRTGNPSKFDFGPLNTLFSGNSVEGLRIRVGGMTMSPLNSHLFGSGYVAYGTKDRRWKYKLATEYSFTPKKHHGYEWPRHGFYASIKNDIDMLGEHYLFTNADNVFLSFKRKESMLATYQKEVKGGYVLELPNQFSVDVNFKSQRQEATPWVPFVFEDGRNISSYRQSSFAITLRWAKGEKFIQGRTQRVPINFDAWIIQLTHEYGPKCMLGSAFTLNRSELSVQKRVWFSAFGYVDMIMKAGKVWDKVYFPALLWPNANLSYTIQPESYSLMNPMEFANDSYAAIDFTYFGNGILFNRLPLLKKLKLREAVTFKALKGDLSDKNNPAKDKSLPLFPFDASPRVMGKTPYMEIGAGLDNIFTFLRVDYVWRLTYRDTPNIDKSGVRVSLHFNF